MDDNAKGQLTYYSVRYCDMSGDIHETRCIVTGGYSTLLDIPQMIAIRNGVPASEVVVLSIVRVVPTGRTWESLITGNGAQLVIDDERPALQLTI